MGNVQLDTRLDGKGLAMSMFEFPKEQEPNYAFSDALICLQQLGHSEEADALIHRWQDVTLDPAVKSYQPEKRPIEWIPDFINARFSQYEQTEWYRLYKAGARPEQATQLLIEKRRANDA